MAADNSKDRPTADLVRETLSYDPNTGVFTWRKRSHYKQHIGAVAGNLTLRGYWAVCFAGKRYYAHRVAWLYVHGAWPSGDIDHINGNKLDNRITNLRVATDAENLQNIRKANADNSSGLLGAHWSGRSKWESAIRVNGKRIRLGYFSTPEEAHLAYLEAKRRLHPTCTI